MTSLLIGGVLLSTRARADDVMIAGHGAQPCIFLNANIRAGEGWSSNALTQGVMSWMQGFVSGANALKRETDKSYFDLGSISRDEQWGYVLDFCRRNPSVDFSHAVSDMMVNRLRLVHVR
jgi:hypothetical protein